MYDNMRSITVLIGIILEVICTSCASINPPPYNLLLQPQNPTNLSGPVPLTTISLTDDHITCARVDLSVGLSPVWCTDGIHLVCEKLTGNPPQHLIRDKWLWTKYPGCALGYYLPEEAGDLLIPTYAECTVGIYLEMIEKCGYDSRFNVGSINVDVLPSPEGAGTAQTAEALRYAMAPVALDQSD